MCHNGIGNKNNKIHTFKSMFALYNNILIVLYNILL